MLETDGLGVLTDFEAIPGYGLKCHVSHIEKFVTDTPCATTLKSVNSYVHGKCVCRIYLISIAMSKTSSCFLL